MWAPLQWVVDLFRRERAKLRAALRPFAIAVAEDLFKRDFNNDGTVANARIELGKLLRGLSRDIRTGLFSHYFNTDGSLKSDVIEFLPLPVLKKVLTIAQLVEALIGEGWPVPRAAILKYGYSILDTAMQDAYEKKIQPKAP